ncbi:hypothetical protein A4A49_54745 [Nicotiana attenuata]|uniref:RNase H type-1 domain-containing protein n=1 Tax=Nicotiana attenuata TaxID=49451 RepID=A0A314L9F8_NICAT|nr:hypothetical protein A4A49_54745 [Nicotiana attenuata]
MAWCKLNTYGSKNMEGHVGVGGICRDHSGTLLTTFSQSVGSISSNMAEVKDALIGLNWCIPNGLDNIISKCDPFLVIDMIRGKSKVLWQMMDIIKQIQNLVSQVNCVICHCFREANQVMNALSKWIIENDELNTFS